MLDMVNVCPLAQRLRKEPLQAVSVKRVLWDLIVDSLVLPRPKAWCVRAEASVSWKVGMPSVSASQAPEVMPVSLYALDHYPRTKFALDMVSVMPTQSTSLSMQYALSATVGMLDLTARSSALTSTTKAAHVGGRESAWKLTGLLHAHVTTAFLEMDASLTALETAQVGHARVKGTAWCMETGLSVNAILGSWDIIVTWCVLAISILRRYALGMESV